MTPDDIWMLPTHHIGRTVHVYDRLQSTNSLALTLCENERHDGLVVLAREQTSGRGQHGRSWLSPPNTSVLMSVLVFPPVAIRRPVLLTAWAALSVCAMIRELSGLEATIKWPNDVMFDGRKICGILIEQRQGTVVGIGLNVGQSARELRAVGLSEATSIRVATGRRRATAPVARRLCHCLDELYEDLCRGDLGQLEARWQSGFGLLGQEVAAECHDGVHRGAVQEMRFDAVTLRSCRTMRRLQPETIRHITPLSVSARNPDENSPGESVLAAR